MIDKKILAMALIGALAASSVNAQGSGAFVEGTVGFGKADLGNTSGWSVDDKDTNWGFMVGYMFNDYFGIEGGYRDLGSVSASTTGTVTGSYLGTAYSATGTFRLNDSADGWLYGVRFNLPINEKFNAQLRAGFFDWTAKSKASATGTLTYGGTVYAANVQASQTTRDTDSYWGVGASYNLTKQLGIGLGYTAFKLNSIDVDSWDLNLSYKF